MIYPQTFTIYWLIVIAVLDTLVLNPSVKVDEAELLFGTTHSYTVELKV